MSESGVAVVEGVGKWHEFHKRSRAPLFTEFILGAPSLQKPGFPFDHRVKHFGIFADHVTISLAEKEALRDKALEHLKGDPEFLIRLMEGAYAEHTGKIAAWKERDAKDLAALSASELADEFARYAEDMRSFGIYVTLPLFAEEYFEEYLKAEFGKRFGNDADRLFGVVADPVRDGTVLEEERARLALIAGGETDDAALSAHAARFGFMKNAGFYEDYYDLSHYRALVDAQEGDAAAELGKLREEREAHRAAFAELLEKLSDDPYLKAVAKTANEAVFFRSYRTEMFYGSASFNQNLFREVAKRLDLSDKKELVWLYSREIENALRAGVSADTTLIGKRKECYAFLSEYDGAYHAWDGEDGKRATAAYLGVEEAQEAVTEVKGSGAFAGVVSGVAVVLNDASELDKVKGGEILVTHATNVNFVPALKKVIGIVTEEGGILSHAAIISRELRIPCVIGTKMATKVFKDGDRLELDAGKGTVRKTAG